LLSNQDEDLSVLIIGAGLSGLACAIHLQERGRSARIFEAGDDVGGRMRTDRVDGFRLDRGFQVLLTAYPEVQQMLDLDALKLRPFAPGARVWLDGRLRTIADPVRRPHDVVATLRSGVATVGDALRIARFRSRVSRREPLELLGASALTALERLRAEGFSEGMINHFFRPFFGGVFLDRELGSAGAAFDFLFRIFADGDATLPAEGIGAVPKQLAARLSPGTVYTNARVTKIDADQPSITLASGETLEGASIVVATEAGAAGDLVPGLVTPSTRSTVCLYFDTDVAPPLEDFLALDGDGAGPANEVCVPSAVAPSYAPDGRSLVSASVVFPWTEKNDVELERAVRDQLSGWFGAAVARWRLLRVVRVREALPFQPPGPYEPRSHHPRITENVFVCGDYREIASVHGALASGRRAADAVVDSLGATRPR